MKSEEIKSFIYSLSFILLDFIVLLFNNELFYKLLFSAITLVIIVLLFKIKNIKKVTVTIILVSFLFVNIGVLIFGNLNKTKNISKGSYLLETTEAINYFRHFKEYSNYEDNKFIVEKATMINKDTNVRYNSTYNYGKSLLFDNIPEGIYTYEISFKDINKKYISKTPEEISVFLLQSNNNSKDESAYHYIKIDEKKAKFSKWSNWSDYSSEKKEKNLLTDVKIKVVGVSKDKKNKVTSKFYDTSKPIYKPKKVYTGAYTEGNKVIPTYGYIDEFQGFEIVQKKEPIYLYNNIEVTYSYRTRTIINYSDVVEDYYAKYDQDNVLKDLGYIKIGIIPKK